MLVDPAHGGVLDRGAGHDAVETGNLGCETLQHRGLDRSAESASAVGPHHGGVALPAQRGVRGIDEQFGEGGQHTAVFVEGDETVDLVAGGRDLGLDASDSLDRPRRVAEARLAEG